MESCYLTIAKTLQHTATYCTTATLRNTLQNLMAIIVDETSFLDCRHPFCCSSRSLCTVTWLIHMCGGNYSRLNHLWHDSSNQSLYLFLRNVIWLIDMWDITRACEWYASFLCDTTLVTWLVHVRHSLVWHDLCMCVIASCDMTRACAW